MALSVRSYRDEDHEACRQLWRQLTQAHRDLYGDQSIGGDGDLGDYFDEHLEHAGAERIWVAELDGRVVGFTSLLMDEKGRPVAELEPVVVAEDARASGVGRALVEHAIQQGRELGLRRIDVKPVARNDRAIAFFHELGFDTLGQLELLLYLAEPKDWPVQARIAGRDFRG